MKSNDKQTTGGTLEEKENSQASEAQENSKGEETPKGTNGRLFEEEEEDNESPNVQGLPMEEAQDVVGQLLKKRLEKAEEYLEIVSDLLGDPASYGYANQTLMGIYDFIESNNHVTDNQVEAIRNIRDNPSKGYGR